MLNRNLKRFKNYFTSVKLIDSVFYLKANSKVLLSSLLFSSLLGLFFIYILPEDFFTVLLEFIKTPESGLSVSQCLPEAENIATAEVLPDPLDLTNSNKSNSNKWTWKGYVATGIFLCLFFYFMGVAPDDAASLRLERPTQTELNLKPEYFDAYFEAYFPLPPPDKS
jgi:hypothetical protein